MKLVETYLVIMFSKYRLSYERRGDISFMARDEGRITRKIVYEIFVISKSQDFFEIFLGFLRDFWGFLDKFLRDF